MRNEGCVCLIFLINYRTFPKSLHIINLLILSTLNEQIMFLRNGGYLKKKTGFPVPQKYFG